MSVRVRVATRADAADLAAFRFEFRATLGKPDENEAAFIERCTRWMYERLDTDRWRCWIAEQDGVLIGNIWAEVIEKMPNPMPEPEHHAYVTNFYVRESARGAGIGSELMRNLMDWCTSNAMHAVFLWPTDRSRPLYSRHGFVADGDIMQRLLSARPH